MKIERIGTDSILVTVDETLYSEEVVYKCFYWYANKYTTVIERADTFFNVTISSQESISDDHYSHLKSRVSRDLIDFKTRQIIYKETHLVKQILIAKAFSKLEDYDEPFQEDLPT